MLTDLVLTQDLRKNIQKHISVENMKKNLKNSMMKISISVREKVTRLYTVVHRLNETINLSQKNIIHYDI